MSFSSEKHLEEILYDAHRLGFYEKLVQRVQNLRDEGYKGSRTDIYLKAWKELI